MKCIAKEIDMKNSIISVKEVTFSGSKEEVNKIHEALKILKKFEKEAHNAVAINKPYADWTMNNYRFDFKENTITVEIKKSSCG